MCVHVCVGGGGGGVLMDTRRDEIVIRLSGEIKRYCLIIYLTQWLLL